MKVLVTGGAGFIGSNFVLRARQVRPEWELTVIDALTYAGNRASLAPVEDEITFVEGSIADADLVDRLVADWTARRRSALLRTPRGAAAPERVDAKYDLRNLLLGCAMAPAVERL